MAVPVILLVLAIAFLGCSQPSATDETAGLKDCGTDAQCITAAANACEKAFATITQASTSPKSSMSIKIIIFGFEADEKCKTKYSIEKIKIDPDEKDAGTIQIVAGLLQGKDMTCLVPKEKLSETETGGLISMQSEELNSMCKGSLVDTMNMVSGGANSGQ